MPTEDHSEEFSTITTATPGSLPADTREPFHRSTAGPSRRLQGQQSDAFLSQSSNQRPPLKREQSQIQQAITSVKASSAKFVGLPYAEKSPDLSEWNNRRLRFLNKRYKLKNDVFDQVQKQHEHTDSVLPSITPTVETPSFIPGGSGILARSPSMESRPRLEKKDSVVKVVYNTVSSFIKRGTISQPKPRHAPLSSRSSFEAADLDLNVPTSILPTVQTVPEELSEVIEEEETSEQEPSVVDTDAEWVEMQDLERPTSLSGGTRPLSSRRFRYPGFESLPILYDEEGNPVARPRHCFAQLRVTSEYTSCPEPLEPDKMKEIEFSAPGAPTRKSKSWTSSTKPEATPLKENMMDSQLRTNIYVPYSEHGGKIDLGSSAIYPAPKQVALGTQKHLLSVDTDRPISRKPSGISRQFALDQDGTTGHNILESMAKVIILRRKPRYRGVGPIARLFNQHLIKREVKKLDQKNQEVLERGEDHRPFFTYWVTTVQILVCIISLLTYNFGSWGFFERVEQTGEVLDTSLALRRVSYYEPTNIWFGPSIANLVRLGAKYSPCMRREKGVWKGIEEERKKENKTACCIFNDRSGCYQTSERECPRDLATWVKWPKYYGNSTKRTSGSVCGQDPDYCRNPQSIAPKEWEDDLTKWPICKTPRISENAPRHMSCQVTGRPCCIQMQGRCRIATREYCDFVKGTWHSEATLCSQVDCFGDICGMLPFMTKDHPNQFYRLFTSLFIHAGIVHLLITLVFHYYFLSDLEALIGWKRMALVYLGSGLGGNLASAIFVPYNPEVGPSGSYLGILAAMIVDVFHHRKLISNFKYALAAHIAVVLLLMVAGLVPFIDNWAHIFGFIFGLLITIACFPYLDFDDEAFMSRENGERAIIFTQENKEWKKLKKKELRRTILVYISTIFGVVLYMALGYVYFANIQIDCPVCGYLNCINFLGLDHYCDNKGLELFHWLPI